MNNKTENWIHLDAEGKTLGRLSTDIARYLQGKDKVNYSPHTLSSNFVVITNVDKITVTGNKLKGKEIFSHSGYMGGLKKEMLGELLETNPKKVLRNSVKGMLPKNKLTDKLINRLKIYEGQKHPHNAQITN
mgnify:FL=1|tara:strand:- start:346 stop:741 length:396 start_codon:yes stop_codon:yes gene_type:complete